MAYLEFKSEHMKRNQSIRIRVTIEEKTKFESIAASERRSLSSWALWVMLNAIDDRIGELEKMLLWLRNHYDCDSNTITAAHQSLKPAVLERIDKVLAKNPRYPMPPIEMDE